MRDTPPNVGATTDRNEFTVYSWPHLSAIRFENATVKYSLRIRYPLSVIRKSFSAFIAAGYINTITRTEYK